MYYGQLSESTQIFLNHYLKFCKQHNSMFFESFLKKMLFDDSSDQDFQSDYEVAVYENLPIEDEKLIDQYYETDNILIIRPYNNQTKLLTCCGFGRQQYNCGGYLMRCVDEINAYREKHQHEKDGYFTMDTTIGMVPDIIGNMETATFSFIPSDTITEYCIEGAGCEPTSSMINEMERILVEGGVCTFEPGSYENEGKYFAKKINGKLVFCEEEHEYNGYPDFFGWCAESYDDADNDASESFSDEWR